MNEYIKECRRCHKIYTSKSGNTLFCPECNEIKRGNYSRHKPGTYSPNFNVDLYELHIKMNAIERAKHNDSIVGEGYAERQIADTLSKVEPIKTEL